MDFDRSWEGSLIFSSNFGVFYGGWSGGGRMHDYFLVMEIF